MEWKNEKWDEKRRGVGKKDEEERLDDTKREKRKGDVSKGDSKMEGWLCSVLNDKEEEVKRWGEKGRGEDVEGWLAVQVGVQVAKEENIRWDWLLVTQSISHSSKPTWCEYLLSGASHSLGVCVSVFLSAYLLLWFSFWTYYTNNYVL